MPLKMKKHKILGKKSTCGRRQRQRKPNALNFHQSYNKKQVKKGHLKRNNVHIKGTKKAPAAGRTQSFSQQKKRLRPA